MMVRMATRAELLDYVIPSEVRLGARESGVEDSPVSFVSSVRL